MSLVGVLNIIESNCIFLLYMLALMKVNFEGVIRVHVVTKSFMR